MKSILVCACVLLTASFLFAAGPNELLDPPTFTSSNGVLDILITAKTKIITLDAYNPASWVYEVCYRSDATNNVCPSDSRTASAYGGMRLQLSPGDHLKIRFINQLPPAPPDAKHVQEMPEMLKDNPTNLHTHGLIVEPRQATTSNPTYGDFIYVLAYPAGKLPTVQMPGLDYTDQPLNYDIYIPPNHPSGLFWVHPHVHGLAFNQMSYGMAGIITIGSVSDILALTHSSATQVTPAVRHLTLKDMEILPDSTVLSQEDPGFCNPDPDPSELPRNGFCPGVDNSGDDGGNYVGGKWIFSINGQEYPTITLAPTGEVWRFTHASGSRSYQLSIDDDVSGQSLPFQVLAIDGVAINGGVGLGALAKSVAGKFTPIACSNSITTGATKPVCATSIRMMPSSRVEIYVPPASNSSSATMLTKSYATGPAGDDWPYARLAHVVFPPGVGGPWPALNVKGAAAQMLSASGILAGDVKIDGGANGAGVTLQSAPKLAAQLGPEAGKVLKEHLAALSAPSELPSAPCVALPPGHRRRIFFGLPADNPDAFGLGYEEVDQNNHPVPGTFRDITEFDHSVIDVCLPLAKGNKTVNEAWELVNVAGEDHNFHIHQTKFKVFNDPSTPGALVDNIPVPHGSDPCDGTIATWRSGACQVKSVYAFIPFSQVGDFVYHCHILEHEDGGMMAHIRVVPNP
jgi:FtsP/CotA-like multicopper oxidase with cupredoxin domain